MKSPTPLLASLVITIAQPVMALPVAFDYLDFKTGNAPVIQVDGNAQGWHSASQAPLLFTAQARGKCAWGYRNTFVSLTLDTNGQPNGGLLAANLLKDEAGSKAMTWSSSWRDISVSWVPNASVRQQAVNACQAHLQQRIAAGDALAEVLGAGHTASMSPAQLGFHFTCDDYGLVSRKEDLWRAASVSIQCKSVDVPAPQPAMPVADKFKPALQLEHVKLTASPENYKGICPKDITFTARISSNGAGGSLAYRFLRDGTPLSAFQPLDLPAGQAAAELHYVMSAQAPASQPPSRAAPGIQGKAPALPQLEQKKPPRIVIEVKTASQQLSDEALYNFTCQTPPAMQAIPVAPSGKADLFAVDGLQLGQVFAPWGGVLKLSAADASHRSPHGCTFRLAYDVGNQGNQAANGFSSRLYDQGSLLHSQENIQLAGGSKARVNGQLTLPSGHYLLRASIDDLLQVEESNESNNTARITVQVGPGCSDATPSPASRASEPARALPRPRLPARQ